MSSLEPSGRDMGHRTRETARRAPADTGASGILVLSRTSSWVTRPKRESGFCPRKRGIPDFLTEGEGSAVVGGTP